MEQDNIKIGLRFKEFRKTYIKLSQEELAVLLETKQNVISDIEHGRRPPPRKSLNKLVKLYKLNAEWLLSGLGSAITTATVQKDNLDNLKTRMAIIEKEMRDLHKTLKAILVKLEG